MLRGRARDRDDQVLEIVTTGHAFGSDVVTNEDYFARCKYAVTFDKEDTIRESRMKTRRWVGPGESALSLANQAVDKALAADPSLRDQIDVVLVSSATTMPIVNPASTENRGAQDLAPHVLHHIGRSHALGMDIKACYCTGFVRCLQVMEGLLTTGEYRAGLIVVTEHGSSLATAASNRSRFCFILADSAGAVVTRLAPKRPKLGLVDYVARTDPGSTHLANFGPDGVSFVMRGERAAHASAGLLIEAGRAILERNDPSQIDWLLPIQSYHAMIDTVRRELAWPEEKMLWKGDETGFAGGASVPAALGRFVEEGVIERGDSVLTLTVGNGMNSGAALFYV